MWVLAKPLDKGSFSWPVSADGSAKRVDLEPAALSMRLAGIDLKDGANKAWYERGLGRTAKAAGGDGGECRAAGAGGELRAARPGAGEARRAGGAVCEAAGQGAHGHRARGGEGESRGLRGDRRGADLRGGDQLSKREIMWPKYKAKADRAQAPVLAPVLAPARARAVPGGYASAGLFAWVVIAKHLDHPPLYRQEQMLACWGAAIPRSTLCYWIRIAADWLEPIYKAMLRRLLEGDYLQANDGARSAEMA